MLSSWQIAQIHAQQSQAFGQQQQYTQQLSAQMPPGFGLAAQGFGGQQMGGGYNYGGGWGGGYGAGNSFGNAMTSSIGGIAHAAGSVSKFGGGIAGGIVGGMMGGPVGSIVGGFAGGLPGGAIRHVAGAFMEGANEQAAIERTLSQFQFRNGASQTGRGFTRNDSQQIGNMVRQMERVPEALTSFGELNRVMDKMGQMGLMQGVRDASDFMRKFRENVSTLKDMAKMMGSTMEGALQAFGESRMAGFYSKGDIARNILNRQVTSSVTGMDQGQIGSLQAYGADMAHSLGGSRRGGAMNMTRTAQQLGMANQMGILTNDQIMEMTGKEGAAGIQDLSAQMAGLSYRMGRSNVGQALTLALGKQENGRFTGEMDEELVEKVRRGELSLGELKAMARRKASTRGAKLSFSAHASRLRTEMAGAVGAEGIGMQLNEILGERGWQNPDAQNLVMQRFGASEEQANLLQQLMPNLQNISGQLGSAGRAEARLGAKNAALREHGWDAIKHKIGTKIAHYTTDWAKDLGNGVRDYFQNWADGFMDDLNGTYREYVTQRVADTVKYSMGGSISNSAALSAMVGRAGKFQAGLGGGRMDVGAIGGIRGAGSRLLHYFGGGQSAGEGAAEMLGELDKGLYLDKGQISEVEGRGSTVLDSSYWTRKAVGLNKDDLKLAQERLTGFDTDAGGMQEWRRTLNAVDGAGYHPEAQLKNAYQQAMQRGDIALESDPSVRSRMIWEEMQKTLSPEVLDKLEKSNLGSLNIIAGVQAAEKRSGNIYRGAVGFEALGKGMLGGLDMKNQKAVGKAIEDQNEEMSKKLQGSDTEASWADITKLVDSGSQMSTLLTGNDRYQGLIKRGRDEGKFTATSPDTVRNIAAKQPGQWSSEDKDVLKSMGIDPDKLASEILKDPTGFDKLRQAAASGKLSEDDILKHLATTEASGLNKISSELNSQGHDLANRLKSDNYKEARAQLSKSKGGIDVLARLGNMATSLEGVDSSNIASLRDPSSDIAAQIEKLSKGDRGMALELAGGDVRSAYGYRQSTRKRLHGGMGVDAVLNAGGMHLGNTDAELGFKKDLEGLLGKNKKLDPAEMEQVLKLLGGQNAAGLRVKAGTETNSTQVSEQEVANSLKSLSDNNVKMATILGNLAGGKTGADLLSGYSAPK